jgi:hypothetical protein
MDPKIFSLMIMNLARDLSRSSGAGRLAAEHAAALEVPCSQQKLLHSKISARPLDA